MENKPDLSPRVKVLILKKEISKGIQQTLGNKKMCLVCDNKMPEDSFVRPCGTISVTCKGCRTGEIR